MGKIVFLGDSLTQSVEVSLTNRWAYKVGLSAGYAPADIINSGISGNRSDQMIARLQADVIAHNPNVCVLMPTVNDRTNSVPIATAEQTIRNIIGQLQGEGIKVTVVSPPLYTSALDQWKPWVEMWEDVAGDMGCHWIDCWREYVYASYYWPNNQWYNYLYVDYVHQSVAGNNFIYSICTRSTHSGAFVKNTDLPAGECPECPEHPNELTLALADLQANGATLTRLQRVISAIDAG